MRTLGNIIWHFPFLGFIFALCYAISGCFWCLTIVGAPLGIGLFQLSSFMLSPFSKALVSRSDLEDLTQDKQNEVMKIWRLIIRILYFPFGLLGALQAIFVIILEFLSIIGIPCGLVYAKALGAIFNPTGKVCVPRAVAEEIERRKSEKILNRYTSKSQTINADKEVTTTETTSLNSDFTAKAEAKSNEELRLIINNASDFHPMLVEASHKVLSERNSNDMQKTESIVVPIHNESDSDVADHQVPTNIISEPILHEKPTELKNEQLDIEEKPHDKPYQATPDVTTNLDNNTSRHNNKLIISAICGGVVLVIGILIYVLWYIPYATDRDALRTYVVANNVFLRSTKVAGVEYNILSKVPYGSELITYNKDNEWAEVKVNDMKGVAASPYLLEWNDFSLINEIWGSADVKEYIESTKCRLALLDYCKRNQFTTGNEGWQLYTLQKDVKPNMVLFPRLNNGYDKFTEFAFILKNNLTKERRFAIYSFDEETETPIFLYEENVPTDGEIKSVVYNKNREEYTVNYTGKNVITSNNKNTSNTTIKAEVNSNAHVVKNTEVKASPSVIKDEVKDQKPPISNTVTETITETVAPTTEPEKVKEEIKEDNNIYTTVEEAPQFLNGGIENLYNFLSKNLRYPSISKKKGIQGRVMVSFIINKDGSTSDFQVIKSVDPYLDKEALRVMSMMPKWKPGKQNGVPVRVKMTVPVNFKL